MNSSDLVRSLSNTLGSVSYSYVGAATGWAMIFIYGAGCTKGGGGSTLTSMATACCTRCR